MHRRSDLFRYLADYTRGCNYPIKEDGVLHSPGVTVFRGAEAEGYPVINPFRVAVISCAALGRPRLTTDSTGAKRMNPRDTAKLRTKIQCMLEAVGHHGHDGLVLSAFGCGAFHNPPHVVAQVFKEELEAHFGPHSQGRTQLQGQGLRVVFAIFDDHNSRCHCGHNPEGNVKPFVDAFASQPSSTGMSDAMTP